MTRADRAPVYSFDPNNLPSGYYGLYDGARFWVSNNRGAMIQKANHAGREWSFWMYDAPNQKWVKVGHKHPIVDGHVCDQCGVQLLRLPHNAYGSVHTKLEGAWDWKRERGKIVDPVTYMRFCDPCLAANGGR